MAAKTTKDTWTLDGVAVMKEIEKLKKKPYVKAGYPREKFVAAHNPKPGEKDGKEKLSVGEIASVHEFGSKKHNIPPRSFIRATHDAKKCDWLKLTASLRKRIMAHKGTVDQSLKTMGVRIVGDIKKTIKKKIPPPLKPATVRARLRKSAKGRKIIKGGQSAMAEAGANMTPLIDTSQLINNLTFKPYPNGGG